MILVAGGTGRLGTEVVHALLARGLAVRVLTRSSSRAAGAVAEGADVVVGDVRDPRSLRPAFDAVDTVVSAVQGFAGPGGVSPESVDRDGNLNLVRAARESGADVVMMSVVGATSDHPMELFRMKAAAEEAVRASGIGYTIVRATAFLELWQELLSKGPRPIVFGRGDNPINFVPVARVAEAVVAAVTDPRHRGQVMNVTGPDDLTLNQLAARVRPDADPVHVPPVVLRLLASAAPAQVRRQARAALVMDAYDLRAGRVP